MHGLRNVKSFVLLTTHVDPTQFAFWNHSVLYLTYIQTYTSYYYYLEQGWRHRRNE